MLAFTPIPTVKLGFFELSTHGLLMAVAFLVAEILARREAKRRGLAADLVDNAAIVAIVAGLVGARLVYVFTFGQQMGFFESLQIWHGGLSSHGGYIFGILAGLAYLKIKKCKVLAYADAVMPYLLIGWSIGRLGCFLNWDSFGRITTVPWAAVVYGEARHPTQLYEALGYLVAFFVIYKLQRSSISISKQSGVPAALALGFFALVRFIVDFWRDDPSSYFLVSQLLTAVIAATAAIYVIWTSKRK